MKLIMCMVLLLTFGACASREETSTPIVKNATAAESKKMAEFGGNCGMGLCLKKNVKGDERYSVEYKGKLYLFSSAEARDKFVSRIDQNIELASKQWSTMGTDRAN